MVASATKGLAGHSDMLAGYVAGSHPDLMAAVEAERLLAGPILGAFEAWLLLRSLGSLGLRFERQCQERHGSGRCADRPPQSAGGAVPGSGRRPVLSGRGRADAPLRWPGVGGTRRRRGGALTGAQQRALVSSTSFGDCTPRWIAGRAGETLFPTVSPGYRPGSKTPTTWWLTFSALCRALPVPVSVSVGGFGGQFQRAVSVGGLDGQFRWTVASSACD